MVKNYLLNPEFILNVVYLTIFLFIVYKVIGNTLWISFQKKFNPMYQEPEKDFDRLIKRKMEMLRSSSGLYVPENESLSSQALRKEQNIKTESHEKKHIPLQFKDMHDDLNWGVGEEVKKILKLFQREFNYTPNEKNTRESLKAIIKEPIIIELVNHSTKDEVLTLLYNRLLLNYYYEEIEANRFSLIKKISSRLNSPPNLFAFALQYTLLQDASLPEKLREKQFSSELIFNKFSSNEKSITIESFLISHSQHLGKSVNAINEIVKTQFLVADFLRPWPALNSLEDALEVLRAHQSYTVEDIKKNYKKLVQEKHPDKISSLKLPKEIEKNALKQFQIIQSAMDIIQKNKGK